MTTPRGVGTVTDALWGTRAHTEGAQIQLPRRIPVRIEPKTFFALERTYLSWMHMAITLGGVTSALVGYSYTEDPNVEGLVSQKTVQTIVLSLLPIAIIMVLYASYIHYMRSRFLEKKQYGFFDDRLGPVVLCVMIMVALTVIMVVAIIDYRARTSL